jgi:tRNA (guanine6-N2)-methyltransferase
MVSIFVVAARGLEWIAAQELNSLPGLTIRDVGYRTIRAEYTGALENLLALRTVDDVFINLAEWKPVRTQRSGLADIQSWAAGLDLSALLELLSKTRHFPAKPTFSVTVNFIGKRNYSWKEAQAAAATGIQRSQRWDFREEHESSLNIRIFIEHERALVGARLAQRALNQRAYKLDNLPGSLKPSAAAALNYLAETSAGMRLVDPFCGAGTIPIEAANQGCQVLAGDWDEQAVKAARANAARAGQDIPIIRWDARRLPLTDESTDRLVSNLPWGRQVQTGDTDLEHLYRDACGEIERILAPGGTAVFLSSVPQLLVFERLSLETRFEISLFGQNPMVLKYTKLN